MRLEADSWEQLRAQQKYLAARHRCLTYAPHTCFERDRPSVPSSMLPLSTRIVQALPEQFWQLCTSRVAAGDRPAVTLPPLLCVALGHQAPRHHSSICGARYAHFPLLTFTGACLVLLHALLTLCISLSALASTADTLPSQPSGPPPPRASAQTLCRTKRSGSIFCLSRWCAHPCLHCTFMRISRIKW